MKLSQMEYFLAVADHLNFTAAAKSLYVSQPALSKQIAMLEEELGVKLFLRSSREVALTEAGKQFKEDLLRIHEEIFVAKERAIQIGKNSDQNIRIGCFDGKMCSDFLPGIYQKIREIQPQMKIHLRQGGFEENKHALDRDEIDLLITLEKDISMDDIKTYRTHRIIPRKGVIVYSKDSDLGKKTEISIEDFERTPLLIVKKEEASLLYERTLSDLDKNHIHPAEIITLKNSLTLFTHLQLGSGYAVMSDRLVQENSFLRTFELKENMDTWVVAVWKSDSQKADFLSKCFTI